MALESLMTGIAVVVGTACIAWLMAPVLAADMRRTVERRTKPPVDMTAIALMIVGGCILVGVPLSAGLLWASWS